MKINVTSTGSTDYDGIDQPWLEACSALKTVILVFDDSRTLIGIAGYPEGLIPHTIEKGMSAAEFHLTEEDWRLVDCLQEAELTKKTTDRWYRNYQGDSILLRCVGLQAGSTSVQLTAVALPPRPDEMPTGLLPACTKALQEFERMPPPHKLYVLIVDDDDDSRYIMINHLQSSNACQYSVAVAPSSAKALEMLRENHFDVCITDFRLLDETAIELHRHSQRLENPPPFIVVTNYPEDTLYAKLLNEGITDLMSKSEITPELLSRSIRYAVQKHRLITDLKRELTW